MPGFCRLALESRIVPRPLAAAAGLAEQVGRWHMYTCQLLHPNKCKLPHRMTIFSVVEQPQETKMVCTIIAAVLTMC